MQEIHHIFVDSSLIRLTHTSFSLSFNTKYIPLLVEFDKPFPAHTSRREYIVWVAMRCLIWDDNQKWEKRSFFGWTGSVAFSSCRRLCDRQTNNFNNFKQFPERQNHRHELHSILSEMSRCPKEVVNCNFPEERCEVSFNFIIPPGPRRCVLPSSAVCYGISWVSGAWEIFFSVKYAQRFTTGSTRTHNSFRSQQQQMVSILFTFFSLLFNIFSIHKKLFFFNSRVKFFLFSNSSNPFDADVSFIMMMMRLDFRHQNCCLLLTFLAADLLLFFNWTRYFHSSAIWISNCFHCCRRADSVWCKNFLLRLLFYFPIKLFTASEITVLVGYRRDSP